MRSYKDFLKAIDRRPIPKNIRTVKQPGDKEIVFCPKAKDWVAVVHGERAV